MELKWEKVSRIEELKVGDIIRSNPNYNHFLSVDGNTMFAIVIDKIASLQDFYSYPYGIEYNTKVLFINDKLKYVKFNNSVTKSFSEDLLYDASSRKSWIEKLITEEKEDKYSDEIDLLLDNIITNEKVNNGDIASYISKKLRGLFVRITSNNDVQILASSSFQLKFSEEVVDTKVADKFINDCIDEFIYKLEKLKIK